MDTALKLKIESDNGIIFQKEEAFRILNESKIVSELTADLTDKSLFYVWRLIALSEIPYAEHLEYTKSLINKIYEKLTTPYGFSLSGDEKMFLPCYNAMVVSALCRLGRAKDNEVKIAVDWINNYQPMKRGLVVSIPGLNFDRYGGCFKKTPCYIGLAKSVIALFLYHKSTGDKSVEQKLKQGIEYLLEHQLINRLSCDKPITGHILDISFPESYHLNIVELIRFASQADLLEDSRTHKAVEYLRNIKTSEDNWKVNYRYKANGYTVFDKGRNSGDWVTHIINEALKKRQNGTVN